MRKQAMTLINTVVSETDPSIKYAHDCRVSMVDSVMSTLIKNEWNPEKSVVRQIVKNVRKNKARLRSVLSRHPLWSSEDQAVILPITEHRVECSDQVNRFARHVQRNLNDTSEGIYRIVNKNNEVDIERTVQMINQCNWFISAVNNRREFIVTKELAQSLEKCGYPHAKVDQKMSRAINAWAKWNGYDKFPQYNKLFAELSDALNPVEIKRKSILSINPVDMLLMSHGNSWTSCHNIDRSNDKMHKSGPMSYMMDKTSMVFSTFDLSCDNIHTCTRINRQMFFFDDGLLVQSRLYPKHLNITLSDTYRDIVQRIIAECLGVINRWELTKDTKKVAKACLTNTSSTHYADYHSAEYLCTLSTIRNIECAQQLTIGHPALCIGCGAEHDVPGQMICPCCYDSDLDEDYEEPYTQCEHCGAEIWSEDDVFYIGSLDGHYCNDCVSYCDSCNEYYFREDVTRINNTCYCEECRYEHCFHCDCCEEWYHQKSTDHKFVYVPDLGRKEYSLLEETWCKHCFEAADNIKPCEHCGEYYTGEICVCELNEQRKKLQTTNTCC